LADRRQLLELFLAFSRKACTLSVREVRQGLAKVPDLSTGQPDFLRQ